MSSKVGSGSIFEVFLPAIDSPAHAPISNPAEETPRGGNETILLVEDDEAVRLLTRKLLETFGYTVHEAASGRDALEVWERESGKFDLLLTDVIMPHGLNGRQLATALRERQANLEVILMSGYSGESVSEDKEFLKNTKSHFLQKPCPSNELLRLVRRCLDKLNGSSPGAKPPEPAA